MASEFQVRQYLAYWFQLGKKVLSRNGAEAFLPQPVIAGDHYSQAFEDLWQYLKSPAGSNAYLEGTPNTIRELLTPAWDISACSRCAMPVPLPNTGMSPIDCPCNDLPGWPNLEMPQPRSPVSSQSRLVEIRDRLLRVGQRDTTAQSDSSSEERQAS